MSLNSKIKKIAHNPLAIVPSLGYRGFLNFVPDTVYLKMVYRGLLGKRLNLLNPKSFNEKIQWLKLHDRNPIYSDLVDKYEANRIVWKIIGKQYIIPNLGGYTRDLMI